RKLPLIVDLDGTFLKVDSLFETFAAGLFAKPLSSLLAILELRHGISAFKQRLTRVAEPDVESFPVREEVLAYLEHEAQSGREIHLATAADRVIALQVAKRFPLFKSVNGTVGDVNLKG